MLAKMFCVKESLISHRLLDNEAKQDMLNGDLPVDALIAHVKVWIENGTPNYTGSKFDDTGVIKERLHRYGYLCNR